MKKIKTKSIETVVNFNRPLSCNELIDLIDDALEEYNNVAKKEWKELPFIKRILKRCYNYTVYCYSHEFYSIDGMSEMKLAGPYPLDPEFYPDAKNEDRHIISIFGNGKYLYFNEIPGVAEQSQFEIWIKEKDIIPCITIKANMKSSPYWEGIQLKFLQEIVPIIERIDKKREATE